MGLAAGFAAAATGQALAGEASGFGFQLRENSASALGSAFAGAAASIVDPRVIADNPAGIMSLPEVRVPSDLSIVIPSAAFSGTGRVAAKQPLVGGNGSDAASAQRVLGVYGFMMPHPN
jgi:long-chain fatty acid transport protein